MLSTNAFCFLQLKLIALFFHWCRKNRLNCYGFVTAEDFSLCLCSLLCSTLLPGAVLQHSICVGWSPAALSHEWNVCTQHRKRIRRPVAMRAESSPELRVRWHLLPLALNGSDSAHLKRQPLKYLVLINALLLIFKRFTYKKNRSGFFIISFHSCKRQETKRQSSALSGV